MKKHKRLFLSRVVNKQKWTPKKYVRIIRDDSIIPPLGYENIFNKFVVCRKKFDFLEDYEVSVSPGDYIFVLSRVTRRAIVYVMTNDLEKGFIPYDCFDPVSKIVTPHVESFFLIIICIIFCLLHKNIFLFPVLEMCIYHLVRR
jgi:hypothetical protein